MANFEPQTVANVSTSEASLVLLDTGNFEAISGKDNYGWLGIAEAGVSEAVCRNSSWEVELKKTFDKLVKKWERETAVLSSAQEIILNSTYQQIIGMGPRALPLILHELKQKPSFWFWALFAITGDDPVPEESHGDVTAMAQAWLDWGQEHGYC